MGYQYTFRELATAAMTSSLMTQEDISFWFDLFYAFKYPIYRKVGYRDLCNKVIYPNEVYKLLSENITFSSSNNPGKCQGGDFVLEVK